MSTNTISFYSNVEAFFSLQQSPIFINMYKPNGEDEKETWYLDEDNDGYHSEIEESVEPPGGRWTDSTSGEDCDDTKSCVTTNCEKVEWYLDNDGDGYYKEKKNDYKTCKPGSKWNMTSNSGVDCNDNRSCVTTNCTKTTWYLDRDEDGWYGAKKEDYASCNSISVSWNTSSNKGKDCNDSFYNFTNVLCFDSDCFKSPVPDDIEVTSTFMASRDCDVCSRTHGGTDYGTPVGTSITSAASGTVVRSYRSVTFGNCVIVDHGVSNIDNDHVYTLYAHGSSLSVNVGDILEAGDQVIVSGNTGNSTGPHLHYEVIKTSDSPNSRSFFRGLSKRYGPDELNSIIDKDCN